jgi:hypothetical protein
MIGRRVVPQREEPSHVFIEAGKSRRRFISAEGRSNELGRKRVPKAMPATERDLYADNAFASATRRNDSALLFERRSLLRPDATIRFCCLNRVIKKKRNCTYDNAHGSCCEVNI